MKVDLAPVDQPEELCELIWKAPSVQRPGVMSVHRCKLEPEHDGMHLCYCGELSE